MIVRAIERGVSEDKLAKALDLDVKAIRRRRTMLGGICPEVVDLLKDKSLNPTTFDVLRKMKPMRQIEAADLMSTAGNYTASYAKAILAATRQADLVKSEQPKKVGGLTPDQMARMEREMETVQQDLEDGGSEVRRRCSTSGDCVRVSVEVAEQQGHKAVSVPASPRDPFGIHRHRVCDIAGPVREHGLEGDRASFNTPRQTYRRPAASLLEDRASLVDRDRAVPQDDSPTLRL